MAASGDVERPRLHFTPPEGWLNDPNGLIHLDGRYHLYFQHNPAEPRWGNIHWGHASSADLVSWENHPIAMAPDANGMIFSGTAVRDVDGTGGFGPGALVAVFTQDLDGRQSQSLAHSVDGLEWTKFDGNPVLEPTDDTPDFRDPKVLRVEAADGDGWWCMVLAVGREVRFYRSDDLRSWVPTSMLVPDTGPSTRVLEVPELIRVPVVGSRESRWVLIVNVIPEADGHDRRRRVRWTVGDFDGERFVPELDDEWPAFDLGRELYAPMCWTDGPEPEPVVIAWMDETASRTALAGRRPWCGRMSLPRLLTLMPVGEKLVLRHEPVVPAVAPSVVAAVTAGGEPIAGRSSTTARFRITGGADVDGVSWAMRSPQGDCIEVTVESETMRICRSDDDEIVAERRAGEASPDLDIVIDRGSIEVFSTGVAPWSTTGWEGMQEAEYEIRPPARGSASVEVWRWPNDRS